MINNSNRVFSAPFSAMISLTNKCNFKCIYCCNNSTIDYKEDMSHDEILDVINQLADMKVFIIHFTGGEMFLRKDVFDFFDAIKPWQRFTMRTNGTTLTHEQIDKLSKYNNSLGIGVSIDGSCEEINAKSRGKGNFSKSLETVKYLIEKGIWTNIMFTVTKFNYFDIENMILLCKSLGCKLTLNKLDPIGRASIENNYSFSYSELNELCKKIYDLDKKYPNILQAESFISRYHYSRNNMENQDVTNNLDRVVPICDLGYAFLYINSDGNVTPCSIMTKPILGNIRNNKLIEIWKNSEEIKKIRKLKELKLKNISCNKENCKYSQGCTPGCRAISQRLYDSLYRTDPFWCLNQQVLEENKR